MDRTLEIVNGCRVMAELGLAEDILGHISLRGDEGTVLLRCRGPFEAGLCNTTVDDVCAIDLATGKLLGDTECRAPNELPLHLNILRARPDVNAVVHAHPRPVVVATLAGLDPRATFGAYNIPAMLMAMNGIPIHPAMGLINDDISGQAVAETLGSHQVCALRGHGLIAVGKTVPEAVVAAHHATELFGMTVSLASLGVVDPHRPTQQDLERLPDLGPNFNVEQLWRMWLGNLSPIDATSVQKPTAGFHPCFQSTPCNPSEVSKTNEDS